MSLQTINLDKELYQYLLAHSVHEHPVLTALRRETRKLSAAKMQISPEQGQFMALLVQLMQAKKTLDIGTFTGYSALRVALSLPEDGQVFAFDTSAPYTDIAKRFWAEAGVADKVCLQLGPAQASLESLLANGHGNSFDFAFIDADKANYTTYYEQAYQLLRVGGLIAIDNVLWDGRVADSNNQENGTQAIRGFNQYLYQDSRVTMCMVPIGDGLSLAVKR